MKILFIGPVFNNYEKLILKTIKKSDKYEKVFFIPDCPIYSLTLYATCYRIFPFLRSYLFRRHNEKIKKMVLNKNIDVLYIIKGEYLDSKILAILKVLSPNLKIIIYQWDSIKNNTNAQRIINFADKTYSFDYVDAELLKLNYLPLFYCWKEAGYHRKNVPVKYDIISIGGYREHRMPYVYAMKAFCLRHNMKFLFHNFIRFGAYIINIKKCKTKLRDINFTLIPYNDYLSILNQSVCVLDIPSPKQEGLTMRTIETLSMGKKLITTNKNIRKESFYNSNVFVIESPEDIESPAFIEFLNTPSVDNQGLLSLTEWLKQQEII